MAIYVKHVEAVVVFAGTVAFQQFRNFYYIVLISGLTNFFGYMFSR